MGVEKKKRGFAVMDRETHRMISRKGGKAVHEKMTGHEWTSEEAREAGRRGGATTRARRREKAVDTQHGSYAALGIRKVTRFDY